MDNAITKLESFLAPFKIFMTFRKFSKCAKHVHQSKKQKALTNALLASINYWAKTYASIFLRLTSILYKIFKEYVTKSSTKARNCLSSYAHPLKFLLSPHNY